MSGCGCEVEIKNKAESRVLIVLLLINALMFLVEIVAGLVGQSTALIADSLDMLADASVYGVALYAVGRSVHMKIRAATLSGVLQALLGIGVLVDVLHRFIAGSEPVSSLMIGVGLAALAANTTCLALIARHRHGDVHMRASWIFSKNDVIANLGVISGGLLVAWLGSPYPDLVIGTIIAGIVVRGGLHIIKDARRERRAL